MAFYDDVLSALAVCLSDMKEGVQRVRTAYSFIEIKNAAVLEQLQQMEEEEAQYAIIMAICNLTIAPPADASQALQSIFAEAPESLIGMPSALSFKVLELTGLQMIADAKNGLGLLRIAECKAGIDQVWHQFLANRDLDLAPGIENVGSLLHLAGRHVDAFSDVRSTVCSRLEWAWAGLDSLQTLAKSRRVLVPEVAAALPLARLPASTLEAEIEAYLLVLKQAQDALNQGHRADAAVKIAGLQEFFEETRARWLTEREQLRRMLASAPV